MRSVMFKLVATILLFSNILLQACIAEESATQVHVDAGTVVGSLDSTLWANIGYEGLYGDTIDARLQPFWELVRSTGAIRYVRCHNLFSNGICRLGGSFLSGVSDAQRLLVTDNDSIESSGTGTTSSFYFGCRIYGEDFDGRPKLDFWHLDHAFDVLLSAGVKPIVECDYMPDDLAEGQPVRNYAGGLINTPKDYLKWRELIYETVKHCVERYGAEEVASWYWEIWNEPNLPNYFIDAESSEGMPKVQQIESFLKMYDYFADGLKAADLGVRVGGPAIARRDGEWLRLFLEHCTSGTNYATGDKGAPLDFISWHGYGSLDNLTESNRTRQEIIDAFPQLSACLWLQDEWGQEFSPINPTTTLTNYEAAFLCQYLASILNESTRSPDLFLRWGKPAHPDFTTGWRPLFVWGPGYLVPLPIMNAYIMLAKMGDERLELTCLSSENGIHGIASRNNDGIQVLLYRFAEQDLLGAGSSVKIALTIQGLSNSTSSLRHYRIDSTHSNAMAAWEDFGKPSTPNERQVAELQSRASLQLLGAPSRLKPRNGRIIIRLDMPVNAVSLLVLGEEVESAFSPGEHITQVLKHEETYQISQQMLANGDTQGAKAVLQTLIQDCVPDELSGAYPHCFWGQRALFTLGKLEVRAGNNTAADLVWQRLLKETLNDTDRLILLKARIRYLEGRGDTLEADSLKIELQTVQARLEVLAWWTVWADTPTN